VIRDQALKLGGGVAAFFAMVFTARILLRVIRWPFAQMVWEPGKVLVYTVIAAILFAVAVKSQPGWRVVAGVAGILFSIYYFTLGNRLLVEAERWGTRDDIDTTSGFIASRGAALMLLLLGAFFLFEQWRPLNRSAARR
jgi:hypothetical protein